VWLLVLRAEEGALRGEVGAEGDLRLMKKAAPTRVRTAETIRHTPRSLSTTRENESERKGEGVTSGIQAISRGTIIIASPLVAPLVIVPRLGVCSSRCAALVPPKGVVVHNEVIVTDIRDHKSLQCGLKGSEGTVSNAAPEERGLRGHGEVRRHRPCARHKEIDSHGSGVEREE
jgi:hypothetical protein